MAKYFTGDLGDVTDPSDAASGVGGFIQRAVVPTGMNIAGEEAGAALAAALGPETGGMSIALPIILGMLGAGGANVAAKHLPESLGGMPDQSNKAAFAWGALPAGAGRGIGAGLAARVAKQTAKAGQESAETFARGVEEQSGQTFKQLQEAVKPPPEGVGPIRRAGRMLGLPNGLALPKTSPQFQGEMGRVNTFSWRDAVNGSINRMREKVAAPLEAAYAPLVRNPAPADVAGLRGTIKGIRASSFGKISQSAEGLLGEVAALEPEKETGVISDPIGLPPGGTQINPGGDIWVTGGPRQPSEGEEILGGRKKLPTWGDVARKRQAIGIALRKATGSDRYVLRQAKRALDTYLTPLINDPNLIVEKARYMDFMNRYPWGGINKLGEAGSPPEVAKWFFDQAPDRIAEVMNNAEPEEKKAYRAMFAQHTFGEIDPAAPVSEQRAALRRVVNPYIHSGVAHELYGSKIGPALRGIVDAPVNRKDLETALAHPTIKKIWEEGFQNEARTAGASARNALDAAYREIVKALPPEQAATLQGIARPTPGQELPVLLNPPEALAAQLRADANKPSQMVGYGRRRITFSVPMGIAAMGMGRTMGAGYALSTAAAFGAIVATNAAYTTFLNHGGAELMAKLYATPAGRKAGAAAFRAMVQLGGRVLNQVANSGGPDATEP